MALGPLHTRNHTGLCCAFLCDSQAVLCGAILHYFCKNTATGSHGRSVPARSSEIPSRYTADIHVKKILFSPTG